MMRLNVVLKCVQSCLVLNRMPGLAGACCKIPSGACVIAAPVLNPGDALEPLAAF